LDREVERLVVLRRQLLAALEPDFADVPESDSPFRPLDDLGPRPDSWVSPERWEYESRLEDRYREYRTQLEDALHYVDPADWEAACRTEVEDGSYSLIVRDPPPGECEELVSTTLIACLTGVLPSVADEVYKRAAHVGPETLLEGVSLDTAIQTKYPLARAGFSVTIKEGQRRTGVRSPIPERVRREVWRRDGGRCVDCGSRERLEYDHVLPTEDLADGTV
jgi:hypothetical protein